MAYKPLSTDNQIRRINALIERTKKKYGIASSAFQHIATTLSTFYSNVNKDTLIKEEIKEKYKDKDGKERERLVDIKLALSRSTKVRPLPKANLDEIEDKLKRYDYANETQRLYEMWDLFGRGSSKTGVFDAQAMKETAAFDIEIGRNYESAIQWNYDHDDDPEIGTECTEMVHEAQEKGQRSKAEMMDYMRRTNELARRINEIAVTMYDTVIIANASNPFIFEQTATKPQTERRSRAKKTNTPKPQPLSEYETIVPADYVRNIFDNR